MVAYKISNLKVTVRVRYPAQKMRVSYNGVERQIMPSFQVGDEVSITSTRSKILNGPVAHLDRATDF